MAKLSISLKILAVHLKCVITNLQLLSNKVATLMQQNLKLIVFNIATFLQQHYIVLQQ